jgi:predicted transcriptional regulator of viral defense system
MALKKTEQLDLLMQQNNGILKTSEAVALGISKTYFGEYVRKRGLERASQGVYLSPDAWEDNMYLLQARFPQAIFSHETALYLLGLADREPLQLTVTVKSSLNASNISAQGAKVYKVKQEFHPMGIAEVHSPAGNPLRVYNPERTICDIIRSRSQIEVQDMQTALRAYVRLREKNLPLLMRYAKDFRVEKILKQYLEVLMP